jgi:hypothetical protein
MVHYLTLAGMVCRPEVRFLRANRKTRPDYLVFDAHGNTLLTDHTVINPISASRAARAASCVRHPSSGCYTPRPSRSCGSRPPRHQMPTLTASRAAIAGKKSLINAMISAVSCAIQKRNGIIIHTNLQKILAAAPPPQVAIIIP